MCGVCGVATPLGRTGDPALVRRMARTLHSRGPDASRVRAGGAGEAVFAMTTLAVVRPGHGFGPFVDPETGVMVTYNGELYGFEETAARRGIPLGPHDTDAAFVLCSYLREGLGFLDHVDGMYAMAIHDPREAATFLVRDRIGQKPLYYREVGGVLHFASETKALLEGPAVTVELPAAVTAVEVPVGRPATPYAGVELLEPGAVLRYDHRTGTTSAWRYWETAACVRLSADRREWTADDWTEWYAAGLATSAQQHRGTGDHALLLSGGVDSGVLAYLLQPSLCFTVRYPGHPELDESERAAKICSDIGAELVVVEPTAADFARTAHRMVTALDYPVGNASLLPEYLCYEAIAQVGVRVVSAGIGPDEFLLGYVRHLMALFGPQAVLDAGFSGYASMAGRLSAAHLDDPSAPVRERYLRLLLRGPDDGTVRTTVEETFAQPGLRPDQALTLVDQAVTLPALLLTSDKLSGAFGLERRSPFLTEELVTLSLTAPVGLRAGGPDRSKVLLRAAARRLGIPEWVVGNTDKQGFASPAPRWLVGGLGPWCTEELTAALADDPPPALAALLRRGLSSSQSLPHERTRMIALMWALWWRARAAHDPGDADPRIAEGVVRR
jgi:asparagine synthase (glutamine-hydrolysing)